MDKNKHVLVIKPEEAIHVIAKLREKGYKDIETDPKDIASTETAIITKSGVADAHEHLTTIDKVEERKDAEPTVDVTIKTSGKEMPTEAQSIEVVKNSQLDISQGKPVFDEKKTSTDENEKAKKKKEIGVNAMEVKIGETDEEADGRFQKMATKKGFEF